MPRIHTKAETESKIRKKTQGKLHKGVLFDDIGESSDNQSDRVYKVTLPGGHSFRVLAKNEIDAKKEIDKVAK